MSSIDSLLLSGRKATIRKKANAVQAARQVCFVYEDDTIAEIIVHNGFARVRQENFNLEEQDSAEVGVDQTEKLIQLIVITNTGHRRDTPHI